MEVLTLKGLKALEKTKNRPENWKALVLNYLQTKEDHIKNLRSRDRPTQDVMLEYAEAVSIARRMRIAWKISLGS